MIKILFIISIKGDLDFENPVRINYDKHGQFLGVDVYCGDKEVEETTLAPTEDTTVISENSTTTQYTESSTEESTLTTYITEEQSTTTEEETTTASSSTTTEDQTTTTPALNYCDSCLNEVPGKYVYHQECMRFCVCEPDGKVTIEDCQFGLIFDYPTQKCVQPLYSNCPYTQWSR